MARKKRIEEPQNHDRWLVSYADFITLLFAFFVVMYSISSVNEGKYRVLSDSIVQAFREPGRELDPMKIRELVHTPGQSESVINNTGQVIEIFSVPLPQLPFEKPDQDKSEPETRSPVEDDTELDEASRSLADSIEEAMSDLVDDELIQVRRDKRWIEVEIKSSLLFASGSGELSPQSMPVLRQLAAKFKPLENVIHVEGFTDNVPISNFDYYSNWELSAARAASVVHLFTGLGIDPQRLAAIGYGEFRPVATNDTAEGRAKNRRVVLVIMSGTDARVSQRLNHLQTLREGQRQWIDPAAAEGHGETAAPAGSTR